MSIIEAKDELIDERSVCCAGHGSPSVYILKIEGAMIPMCETCIEELKKRTGGNLIANTTTTHASVAAQLTDEEIETLAQMSEQEIPFGESADDAAAVLRDYLRLRKLNCELRKCLNRRKER